MQLKCIIKLEKNWKKFNGHWTENFATWNVFWHLLNHKIFLKWNYRHMCKRLFLPTTLQMTSAQKRKVFEFTGGKIQTGQFSTLNVREHFMWIWVVGSPSTPSQHYLFPKIWLLPVMIGQVSACARIFSLSSKIVW